MHCRINQNSLPFHGGSEHGLAPAQPEWSLPSRSAILKALRLHDDKACGSGEPPRHQLRPVVRGV